MKFEYPDPKDILEYLYNFYGYGNIKSDIWFIGLEPATDDDTLFNDIISKWIEKNKKTINSIEEIYENEVSKIQPTWAGLITLYLSYKSSDETVSVKKEDILAMQEKWCKTDSDHCLIEMFPLPCRNMDDWRYKEIAENHSELFFLKSKCSYQSHIKEIRFKRIFNLIKEYGPKIIVIYTKTMGIDLYKLITGNKPVFHSDNYCLFDNTYKKVVICLHPTLKNFKDFTEKDQYFSEIGKKLRC